MDFIELLEREYDALDESTEYVLEFLRDSSTDEEYAAIITEAFGELDEDLMEALVKRVRSDGTVRKTLNRAIRTRRASLTTGMSKANLRIRGRKAARTRKRSAGTVRKALRKRRKAMRRRKQMGIK